uniref:Deoxynucleotidyltransferase terminal-interacting protein 1 n=1 Tax=Periophthalmus magnuspinnatus TaxID=409849 RepID=A0A3B4AV01_9GOBI
RGVDGGTTCRRSPGLEPAGRTRTGAEPGKACTQPWNLMIKHRPIQKRGRRSHLSVSYTDPQISMELLRAVLQPSLNQEILQVFSKYHQHLMARPLPTEPESPVCPPVGSPSAEGQVVRGSGA